MKRTILIAALLAITTPALSQSAMTRAQLESFINANIKTNGVGAITGPIMNTQLNNLAASMATLQDTNTFNQLQTIPGLPGLTTNVEGGGSPGLDMPACTTQVTCSWMLFSSPTAYPAAGSPLLYLAKEMPATGGNPADDYNVILAQLSTGLNDNSGQWGISSVVLARTLASSGSSQAIAVAGTVFKQLNGQAPGTQIEGYSAALYGQCVDETLNVNPTSSCIGGEVDSYALPGSGTDSNHQRVALQLNGGTNGANDTGVHIGTLILMGANNGVVIDRAMAVYDASSTETFLIAGNGAEQINSNLGGWGNTNVGKQLIVMPENVNLTNPAIGISDLNQTNFIALENSAGSLLIEGMPALNNSSTAPTIFVEFVTGGLILPNVPTTGAATYACFNSSKQLVSSTTAC